MAPEQATGHDVDGRADIYSLGVILYEMLIGDVPFNAASTPAVLMMHVNDAPEPPSRRRPDLPIPPALEAIALRCLEKDPAQRFQTAEEFSEALERAVPAGAPLTSPDAPDAPTALLLPPPLPADPASSLPVHVASSVAPAQPVASVPAGTGPTIKAPDATVLRAGIPASPGRGNGRLITVLLAVATLFFAALAVAGYAAYRAWTSRSDATTAETVPNDPAPVPVPPAPDSTPPPEAPSAAPAAAPLQSSRDAPREPGASPSGRTTAATAASPAANVAAGGSAPAEGEAGTPLGGTPSTMPPSSQPLPQQPPIYLECTGTPDVCGALTTAIEQALEREGLPRAARPEGAEILVHASATLLETRQDHQFGTSFVVQTFSLELRAEATRDGSAVSMPAARTFSFDRRFGAARAAEQATLMAVEAADRIQKFWTKRIGR